MTGQSPQPELPLPPFKRLLRPVWPQGDAVELYDGSTMLVHSAINCDPNKRCCIHRPSTHPLNNAPFAYASTINAMFRVCEHSEVHPDPDAMRYLRSCGEDYGHNSWHRCCPKRCCGGARSGGEAGRAPSR